MVRWFNTAGDAVDNDVALATIARPSGGSANTRTIVASVNGVDIDANRAMVASVDIDVNFGISEGGYGSETDSQDEDEHESAFHIAFLLCSNVRQLLPKLASE